MNTSTAAMKSDTNFASLAMAALSGLVFSIGLSVAEMTNPAKVQNFLDLAGQWDPSLIFVMIGGICVTLPGYKLLRPRSPWFAESFQWPTRRDIDTPLIVGAVFFGVGWALSGLCPGPAIAGLATLTPGVIGFVFMMLLGATIAHHQKRLNNLANQQN